MKKNRLSLLFLFAVLSGCTLPDITPSYYGRYNFAYKVVQTKNGIVTGSSDVSAGFMEVAEGSAKKTVTLNNFVDSKGKIIDFELKLGFYKFFEKYEKDGCQCENTIEGQFDSGNYMTYKQQLIVTCEKDVLTAIVEGKGVR